MQRYKQVWVTIIVPMYVQLAIAAWSQCSAGKHRLTSVPSTCRADDSACSGLSAGAVIGSCSGITSWLVTAQLTQGSISILNTEANAPLLAGNLISNLLSLLLVVSISLIFPEGRFDWEILKEKITSADVEVSSVMSHLRSPHRWPSVPRKLEHAEAGPCAAGVCICMRKPAVVLHVGAISLLAARQG